VVILEGGYSRGEYMPEHAPPSRQFCADHLFLEDHPKFAPHFQLLF